jgi:hypothetical protein
MVLNFVKKLKICQKTLKTKTEAKNGNFNNDQKRNAAANSRQNLERRSNLWLFEHWEAC